MSNDKIEKLLKLAEKLNKKTTIKPRQFERSEDGKLILNENKTFDKDWYENDEAYDIV